MFVSETYGIEDCVWYDSLTENKGYYSVQSGSASISYSSDGLSVRGTASSNAYVKNNDLILPNDYIAEYTITAMTKDSGGWPSDILFENIYVTYYVSNYRVYYEPWAFITQLSESFTSGDIIKLEVDSTAQTMKIYINNNLVYTATGVVETHYQRFKTYNNRAITIKDLKVKPL